MFQTLASADQKFQQTTQGCPFSRAAFLLHATVLPQQSLSGNPLELHNILFSINTLYMSPAITQLGTQVRTQLVPSGHGHSTSPSHLCSRSSAGTSAGGCTWARASLVNTLGRREKIKREKKRKRKKRREREWGGVNSQPPHSKNKPQPSAVATI